MFENRGNDEFLARRGQFQGENRKAISRLTRIFDVESGLLWQKRRRFRFFKQALDGIEIDKPHRVIVIDNEESSVWNVPVITVIDKFMPLFPAFWRQGPSQEKTRTFDQFKTLYKSIIAGNHRLLRGMHK
ncbi:hypothetical protein [Acutalibacter caecimuris]|uniref:hypothetical protein n=1 Tax=Acutalibacter caecimuris TaxID=3093657 RepID=UPI002AC92C3B|nr:hypothetical protein [Acutalibacter sp. M00118]